MANFGVERRSQWYKALFGPAELQCLLAICAGRPQSNYLYSVSFGPEISANGFERSNSKIPHDMFAAIVAAAGSIGTHLRAKVQPHAPCLLDAACTQAFSHSLAEANVVISLAATGECSSCQCLSASALLVVFPMACPYSSLFVTAFRSRRIVVCMYRDSHVLQNSPRGLL